MATLPWTPARSLAAGADALVLGSRLELRHYRDIPRFMWAAMKVRKQMHQSNGALGVSLIAQPARKAFWTLSAWADQASLDAFVGSRPHLDVMGRFRERLTNPQFTTWTVAGTEMPKPGSSAKNLWREAKTRLVTASSEGTR
jgi:hypothetical protein